MPRKDRQMGRDALENATAYFDNDIDRFDDGKRKEDRQFVSALGRGLEILRCFRPGERYLGVTAIAGRIGIPKPSASRLLGTLSKLGYLDWSRSRSKYSLAPGVLSLGYAMLSNVSICRLVRPMLKDLAEFSRASVSIGMLDRLSMVYVESVRSSAPVGLRRGVGSRLPLGKTAIGRAYLAGLLKQERAALMDQLRQRDTEEWPSLLSGIEQGLHDYAERGFCISIGEWEADVSAVGVPFVDSDGTRMAISCGGASFLLRRDKLENDIGPRLVSLVEQISGASRI